MNAPVVAPDINAELIDFSVGESAFASAMDALRNGPLQIPEPMPPDVWIEKNIRLSKQETSRPGPLKLTGYQRAVARDLADPEVDEVDILKGAQVGWSRFISAMLCYFAAYEATKVAIWQPTDPDAQSFYRDTLEPRFRDVPAMAAIAPREAETWQEHRYLNGATLYVLGAASDVKFRRRSIRIGFGDEVDAAPWSSESTNASDGDKIELMRARGTDFWDSKIGLGSTPVFRDSSRIWKAWSLSDQREPNVRCPHCSTMQMLKWGSDKTPFGFKPRFAADKRTVESVYYECEHCHAAIEETEKHDLVESVEFVPTAVPDRPGHRGYRWPAWLSEAPKSNWVSLMTQFFNAVGDPKKLQVWVNNVSAEPFDDMTGSSLDSAGIQREFVYPYPAEVPDDVVVLTAGADTQTAKESDEWGDKHGSREITVVGWTANEMPRVIGHWIVDHEPGLPEHDREMDAILNRVFKNRFGHEFKIEATAIDMGGHHGDDTRLFAQARVKKRVWAVKGKNNKLGTRDASVWPKKMSRDRNKGFQWAMIDSQLARDVIGRKLKISGPGGPMFPKSLPESYFEGLAAFKFVVDKSGRKFWQKKGRNTGEAFMCLAYAYAALRGLMMSETRWRDLNTRWTALNLARRQAGMTNEKVDPETGEIIETTTMIYDGDDMSAQSTKAEVISAYSETSSDALAQEPKQKPKVARKRPSIARSAFMSRY